MQIGDFAAGKEWLSRILGTHHMLMSVNARTHCEYQSIGGEGVYKARLISQTPSHHIRILSSTKV
jgi:hypothetical protein